MNLRKIITKINFAFEILQENYESLYYYTKLQFREQNPHPKSTFLHNLNSIHFKLKIHALVHNFRGKIRIL